MRVGGAGLIRHPCPDRPCARHVSVTESCTSLVCCPPSDNGTWSYRGQHRSPLLVGPAGLSEHG
jgi:hypothetical protein